MGGRQMSPYHPETSSMKNSCTEYSMSQAFIWLCYTLHHFAARHGFMQVIPLTIVHFESFTLSSMTALQYNFMVLQVRGPAENGLNSSPKLLPENTFHVVGKKSISLKYFLTFRIHQIKSNIHLNTLFSINLQVDIFDFQMFQYYTNSNLKHERECKTKYKLEKEILQSLQLSLFYFGCGWVRQTSQSQLC